MIFEKINKKNILIFGVIILGIALCLWLVSDHGISDLPVRAKAINQNVDLDEVFAEIAGVEEIEFSDENAYEDEIDFGKYNVLERKAIVNTVDNNVDEVWMVKLSDYNQQEDIMRIFGNRIQKLRNGFEASGDQVSVLDNAVIKQEDGIVIMIASPDVYEIEKTIASVMGK